MPRLLVLALTVFLMPSSAYAQTEAEIISEIRASQTALVEGNWDPDVANRYRQLVESLDLSPNLSLWAVRFLFESMKEMSRRENLSAVRNLAEVPAGILGGIWVGQDPRLRRLIRELCEEAFWKERPQMISDAGRSRQYTFYQYLASVAAWIYRPSDPQDELLGRYLLDALESRNQWVEHAAYYPLVLRLDASSEEGGMDRDLPLTAQDFTASTDARSIMRKMNVIEGRHALHEVFERRFELSPVFIAMRIVEGLGAVDDFWTQRIALNLLKWALSQRRPGIVSVQALELFERMESWLSQEEREDPEFQKLQRGIRLYLSRIRSSAAGMEMEFIDLVPAQRVYLRQRAADADASGPSESEVEAEILDLIREAYLSEDPQVIESVVEMLERVERANAGWATEHEGDLAGLARRARAFGSDESARRIDVLLTSPRGPSPGRCRGALRRRPPGGAERPAYLRLVPPLP